jgi:hypothetical protein
MKGDRRSDCCHLAFDSSFFEMPCFKIRGGSVSTPPQRFKRICHIASGDPIRKGSPCKTYWTGILPSLTAISSHRSLPRSTLHTKVSIRSYLWIRLGSKDISKAGRGQDFKGLAVREKSFNRCENDGRHAKAWLNICPNTFWPQRGFHT